MKIQANTKLIGRIPYDSIKSDKPPLKRLLLIKEKYVAITGECFCGKVKYQINRILRNAVSCHCSRCRKAFSSQASAYSLVEPKEFEWITGDKLLTSYVNKKGFSIQFCSKCGSTLCGILDGAIHGVTLGCVNGDPNIELGRHIYVGSKASWEVIPECVLQYQEDVPVNT